MKWRQGFNVSQAIERAMQNAVPIACPKCEGILARIPGLHWLFCRNAECPQMPMWEGKYEA